MMRRQTTVGSTNNGTPNKPTTSSASRRGDPGQGSSSRTPYRSTGSHRLPQTAPNNLQSVVPSSGLSSLSSDRRRRLTLLSSRRRPSTSVRNFSFLTPNLNEQSRNSQAASRNSDESRNNGRRTMTPPRFHITEFPWALPRQPSSVQQRQGRSRSRSRPRISPSSLSVTGIGKSSMQKVLEVSHKHLPKIFKYLNWNELLKCRVVSKRWLEVISTHPEISSNTGVVVIGNPWEESLQVFNDSPVTWRRFRFQANMFIDLTDSTQLQFWIKHGPLVEFLEIRDKVMTVTGLVEILSRCKNLCELVINWTPEMYPFNAELIRKHYGINFYNGSFTRLQSLTIERSCYLSDVAFFSLLKWCGGSLQRLALTYPPETQPDAISRLRPRWTINPLREYINRFGYTGNLQHLDFSWSSLSAKDLKALADTPTFWKLRTLNLSHSNVNDESLIHFFTKKGSSIQILDLEEVPISDEVFHDNKLPELTALNISGSKGKFTSLQFILYMENLRTLKVSQTTWMDYYKIMPILTNPSYDNRLEVLEIAGNMKVNGSKVIDSNMNKTWFSNFVQTLSHLTTLNVSFWSQFGNDDNFQTLCSTLSCLQELRVRDWKDLTDTGVTGFSPTQLHNASLRKSMLLEPEEKAFIGLLKYLRVLDLSGSNVSDVTVTHGIVHLPNIRQLGFENTQVGEAGLDCILEKIKSIDKISCKGCRKIATYKIEKLQRNDGRFVFNVPI